MVSLVIFLMQMIKTLSINHAVITSQLTTLHWANVDIKLEWLDAETSRWPNIGAMQVSNIGNQFGVIRSAMQSSKLHFVGVLKCEYMKLAVLYHHPT